MSNYELQPHEREAEVNVEKMTVLLDGVLYEIDAATQTVYEHRDGVLIEKQEGVADVRNAYDAAVASYEQQLIAYNAATSTEVQADYTVEFDDIPEVAPKHMTFKKKLGKAAIKSSIALGVIIGATSTTYAGTSMVTAKVLHNSDKASMTQGYKDFFANSYDAVADMFTGSED